MKKLLMLPVLAAMVAFSLSAEASAGALDPSFGQNGRVISALPKDAHTRSQIAQAPSGTIYVLQAGTLLAFAPNGQPERGFGVEGALPLGQRLPSAFLASFAIDDEGRVVVAGTTGDSYSRPANLMLARLLPNGQLDPSFGSGGTVTTDLGLGASEGPTPELPRGVRVIARSVAVDRRGRIVVIAHHVARFEQTKNGPMPRMEGIAARFTPGGALDSSYGGSAGVATGFAPSGFEAASFAPDGSVFVAAWLEGKPALRRLSANGQLDPGFGTQGWRPLPPEWERNLVADGHSVVVWRSQRGADQMTVRRLRADGRLDRSFGRKGVFRQNFGTRGVTAVVPDGTGGYFLSADWRRRPGESKGAKTGFLLGRLTSRGHLDRGFGRVKAGFGRDSEAQVQALSVDRRGRPLLLGETTIPSTGGARLLALARYRPPR